MRHKLYYFSGYFLFIVRLILQNFGSTWKVWTSEMKKPFLYFNLFCTSTIFISGLLIAGSKARSKVLVEIKFGQKSRWNVEDINMVKVQKRSNWCVPRKNVYFWYNNLTIEWNLCQKVLFCAKRVEILIKNKIINFDGLNLCHTKLGVFCQPFWRKFWTIHWSGLNCLIDTIKSNNIVIYKFHNFKVDLKIIF